MLNALETTLGIFSTNVSLIIIKATANDDLGSAINSTLLSTLYCQIASWVCLIKAMWLHIVKVFHRLLQMISNSFRLIGFTNNTQNLKHAVLDGEKYNNDCSEIKFWKDAYLGTA